MNDITIFPADIAEMSVSQLAALPPAQKHEIDKNLDAAIDWLKKARTKFDAALDQCYGEQARTALRESGRDGGSDRCSAAVSCESDHATTISCAPSCSHAQFVVSFPAGVVLVLIAASLLARPMSRRPVPLLVRSRLERPPQRLT